MTTQETNITANIVQFVLYLKFEDIPPEAVRISKRCVLDGLGRYPGSRELGASHNVADEEGSSLLVQTIL